MMLAPIVIFVKGTAHNHSLEVAFHMYLFLLYKRRCPAKSGTEDFRSCKQIPRPAGTHSLPQGKLPF